MGRIPKYEHGHPHVGDVLTTQHSTLVHAFNRLVIQVGVSNLIVVETPDIVLVADKARSQDVKHIVAQVAKHPTRRAHPTSQGAPPPAAGTIVSTKVGVSRSRVSRANLDGRLLKEFWIHGLAAPPTTRALAMWLLPAQGYKTVASKLP